MPKTFPLEIVTPEKPILKEDVEFLVVPAAEGELGILPGHIPLLAQLKEGELRFTQAGQERTFVISGGFLEVHQNHASVFAETAEMAEEINAERARAALERAKEQLRRKEKEVDLMAAQADLRRAAIRLKVAEQGRRKSLPKGKR